MSLKVFNIFNTLGNADSNFFEISSYPSQEGEDQEHSRQQTLERIGEMGSLFIICGIANWCSRYGNHCGDVSKN